VRIADGPSSWLRHDVVIAVAAEGNRRDHRCVRVREVCMRKQYCIQTDQDNVSVGSTSVLHVYMQLWFVGSLILDWFYSTCYSNLVG
jgi:hypothetical protein